MFGDPVHGGNADFVGWDLIGFYGVKLEVTAAEQQLDVTVAPAHKSVADYPMFSGVRGRATVMTATEKGADVVASVSAPPAERRSCRSRRPGSRSWASRRGRGTRCATTRRTRSATTSATGSGGPR